jgi:hypothetical protein
MRRLGSNSSGEAGALLSRIDEGEEGQTGAAEAPFAMVNNVKVALGKRHVHRLQ